VKNRRDEGGVGRGRYRMRGSEGGGRVWRSEGGTGRQGEHDGRMKEGEAEGESIE